MYRFLPALILVALAPLPAAADPGIALVPQAPGQRIHFRIAQTHQTVNGPLSTSTAFDIVRRAGTALVIERAAPNGTPNLSVLKSNADGTLALAEEPNGVAADADVADLLNGLNLAIGATRAGEASAHTPWQANVAIAGPGGTQIATLAMTPLNASATDFDFSGAGEALTTGAPAVRRISRRSSLGIPGGGGGAGGSGGADAFPGAGGGGRGGGAGAGSPRGGSGGGDDSDSRPAPRERSRNGVTDVIRVDGHVSNGRVIRVGVTQTRTVMVDTVPFTNVASWTITADK